MIIKREFIEKALAYLTVFFIPSQLALHFWPPSAFVFGIRVDYLSPAIYFTDILVFTLICAFLLNAYGVFKSFVLKNRLLLFIFVLLAVFNIAFSKIPAESLYKWIKIAEAFFAGIYIYLRKDFLGVKKLLIILFISAFIVSLVGIAQFFLGRTTGLFYLAGERSFNVFTPGISLVVLSGVNHLRAYSVFPHPNALAGYLGMALLSMLSPNEFKNSRFYLLGLLVIAFCFVLTFSLTAYLGVFVLVVFSSSLFITKRQSLFITIFFWIALLGSLLLPLFINKITPWINFSENLSQRLELSYVAGELGGKNIVFGTGLNTFIPSSVKFIGTSGYTWLLQPAHNIFLLWFAETGIIGLIFGFYVIYKITTFVGRSPGLAILLFFVLFTGLADHYWLTIQQNLLFTSFLLGLKLRSA